MHLDDQALLMGDLEAYINQGRTEDGTVITSFVAEAMNRIVGIVILREERHIEWLRANYEIEDFIYFGHHSRKEHATLFHCVLAVNFHCRYGHFLREVMRQGGKTCLYYHIMPPYCTTELYCRSTLVTCLPYLYPVKPRRQIIYPPREILGEKAPAERLLVRVADPPALFLGTAQLLVEPREEINARIIVVGASTTGLAVLTTLVMCSHIRFRNLVLLSPNGLPGETLEKPSELVTNFLSTDHCFPLEHLGQYALRHCVHVVHGKLTAIDRKFKFITIDHGQRLDYDYLVLTTGLQYHISCPENAKIVEAEDNVTQSRSSARSAELPVNVFLTIDFMDAERILHWISEEYIPALGPKNLHVPAWKKSIMQRKQQAAFAVTDQPSNEPVGEENKKDIINDGIREENKLIVYGYRLDAYTCVATLLRAGIPGRYIVMVQPPIPPQEQSTFDNPVVENFVHSQMAEMEVQICKGYVLHGWRVKAPEERQIEEVTFVSSQQKLRILCKALFCYDKRRVDYDLFSAANDACLVFDARLVIDANFHTNDPAIRAAGPVTKLQRIYFNDFWRHELGSSLEIGTSLGQQMLTLFSCDNGVPQKPEKDSCHLLPEFHEPKVIGGILPGEYHYLHISKPELPDLAQYTKNQSHKDRMLTTGTPNEDHGLFCLHINQYNAVQALTCLSKTPFPASNYIQLFGAHEKLLNNLLARYDEGLIPDMYRFFNDVWPLAIYHNRFAEFRTELRELLHSHTTNGINSLTEKIQHLIAEGGEIKQEDMERLKTLYTEDGYSEMVEEELFSFINSNYDLLPMYAKPDLV
ncbi:unnamed protein product [Dicrocoelium dendriticum]|nr:unnamed protein product [Dicrocoelium dendriticum]